VISERESMRAQRAAIETFLNQIRVGDARTGAQTGDNDKAIGDWLHGD
jgi:hypothetical protein